MPVVSAVVRVYSGRDSVSGFMLLLINSAFMIRLESRKAISSEGKSNKQVVVPVFQGKYLKSVRFQVVNAEYPAVI